MLRRRGLDPIDDAATARAVLRAAGAVTGAPLALLTNGPMNSAELRVVRMAAAVALMQCGWTRERVSRSIRIDRAVLAGDDPGERCREHAPAILAAALAAAKAETGRRKVAPLDAEAREVMRHEATRAGLDVAEAATSRDAKAAEVRRRVARRLFARNYGGTAIARALGYSETTVYRWLDKAAATRPC